MVMTMKYITFKRENGDVIPFIFPSILNHSDVARALKNDFGPVRSAGMVRYDIGSRARCYGESTTLSLQVHPNDNYHIRRWLEEDFMWNEDELKEKGGRTTHYNPSEE